MSKEEQIWYLQQRIDKLNDDIDKLDIKLAEQSKMFNKLHKSVEESKKKYEGLKSFTDQNDPTGILFYDPENVSAETMSTDIDPIHNKQLYDLKKDLENKRFQYEQAKRLMTKNETALQESYQRLDAVNADIKVGNNKYLVKWQKQRAKDERIWEIRRGRKIYIPLAILFGFLGCAISLPAGLLIAGLTIGATVVIREITRKTTLQNIQDKNYTKLSKREQQILQAEEVKIEYEQSKQARKSLTSLQHTHDQETEKVNQLREKNNSDQKVFNQANIDYQNSIQKFNTFLTACQENKKAVEGAKQKWEDRKQIEDDVVSIIDICKGQKEKKENEIQEIKQQINDLKNGSSFEKKNQAGNSTKNTNKGKRS